MHAESTHRFSITRMHGCRSVVGLESSPSSMLLVGLCNCYRNNDRRTLASCIVSDVGMTPDRMCACSLLLLPNKATKSMAEMLLMPMHTHLLLRHQLLSQSMMHMLTGMMKPSMVTRSIVLRYYLSSTPFKVILSLVDYGKPTSTRFCHPLS